MDIITGAILIGLTIAFIGAILTSKFELCIMSVLMSFCAFIAVTKDATIAKDIVMVLYVPILAIGLFSISQFFKSKV